MFLYEIYRKFEILLKYSFRFVLSLYEIFKVFFGMNGKKKSLCYYIESKIVNKSVFYIYVMY